MELDPMDLSRDAAQRADDEGTRAGRLLLPSGVNPYLDTDRRLARFWEESRREAAAQQLKGPK